MSRHTLLRRYGTIIAASLFATSGLLVGCEETEDAAEETGDAVEDAAEEAGDAVEDTTDDMN